MNIIICGGGTAGHVTPGIAIAQALVKKNEATRILFIGRCGGEENELIKKYGFDFQTLEIYGLSRKKLLKNIKNASVALKAIKTAKRILKDFGADAVIGTGGYVCWPVIKAARALKIPTAIHESNVCPGLTTRLLAKKCDKVFLNFPGSEKEFGALKNLHTVGNPMLSQLTDISRDSARKKLGLEKKDFLILSFGGSGGAEFLNKNVIDLMRSYSCKKDDVKHIHGSGRRYFEDIRLREPSLTSGKAGCKIIPFITDMPTYVKAADAVICRCGAMTLSEVSMAGAIPILIPSPNVTDNHQYKNGKLFADRGAAIMIEETELNVRTLTDAVEYLKNNAAVRLRMRKKLSAFSNENSCETIVEEIEKLCKK